MIKSIFKYLKYALMPNNSYSNLIGSTHRSVYEANKLINSRYFILNQFPKTQH